MSQRTRLLIAVACLGALIGVLASEAPIYGAPATKKECGAAGTGANNNNCNTLGTPITIGTTKYGCLGNCKFPPQGYKTCTGTPGTCKDDKETQCNGWVNDGGADGKGCDGAGVKDDVGAPMTCQNNKFKYCT